MIKLLISPFAAFSLFFQPPEIIQAIIAVDSMDIELQNRCIFLKYLSKRIVWSGQKISEYLTLRVQLFSEGNGLQSLYSEWSESCQRSHS